MTNQTYPYFAYYPEDTEEEQNIQAEIDKLENDWYADKISEQEFIARMHELFRAL
jgi:hypothetical protein